MGIYFLLAFTIIFYLMMIKRANTLKKRDLEVDSIDYYSAKIINNFSKEDASVEKINNCYYISFNRFTLFVFHHNDRLIQQILLNNTSISNQTNITLIEKHLKVDILSLIDSVTSKKEVNEIMA